MVPGSPGCCLHTHFSVLLISRCYKLIFVPKQVQPSFLLQGSAGFKSQKSPKRMKVVIYQVKRPCSTVLFALDWYITVPLPLLACFYVICIPETILLTFWIVSEGLALQGLLHLFVLIFLCVSVTEILLLSKKKTWFCVDSVVCMFCSSTLE